MRIGLNLSAIEVDDQVESLLRRAGQRYTRSRQRLVATLRAGVGPVTISQILAADGALPQSTVYRNLTTLEEVGAVTRIATSDEFTRYELAEDLTGRHHHFICSTCGDVVDFLLDRDTEVELEQALGRAADGVAFAVNTHRLDIIGHCSLCQHEPQISDHST